MQHHRPIGWIQDVAFGSPSANRVITAPKHEGAMDNRYCGPAAASALTGCTVKTAVLLFQTHSPLTYSARGKARGKHIQGTCTYQMREVLKACGFEMANQGLVDGTLAAWVEGRTAHDRDPQTAYLIDYATHWGVVQGEWFVDNQRGLVRLDNATMRRGQIRNVHAVRRKAVIDFDAVRSEYTKRMKSRVRLANETA